jgi:hypothetical protein
MLYRQTYALQALMLIDFADCDCMAPQACAQAQHLSLRAVVLAVGFDLRAALESHGVTAICCSWFAAPVLRRQRRAGSLIIISLR